MIRHGTTRDRRTLLDLPMRLLELSMPLLELPMLPLKMLIPLVDPIQV
jgi:hypothetical protein